MYTFLNYLNKTRDGDNKLNELNYNFLCEAMKKILELNKNEDIDYNLNDLLMILSLSYYKVDPNYKNNKKYANEAIKMYSVLKEQGFWVGYVKFKIKEQVKFKSELKNILEKDYLLEDELNNDNTNYKLISILYHIIQFISDSNLFNNIIFDIFKHFKIQEKNREIIIGNMEHQIESNNIKWLVLNKELLLYEE